MSISEIRVPNSKTLYCKLMVAENGFEGAFGVAHYSNEVGVGPVSNPSYEFTIVETLTAGEIYWVHWQAQGGNATTGTPFAIDLTFDSAGQNEVIGFSGIIDSGAWASEPFLFSGFRVLTIDTDGAGAGKKM